MDKQNTSQLLRIILLFGSIGLLIGLVYFVDTTTNFLKKTGRYGFIRNDETIINALLYRIQYEYGQGITRERLLDSLSMSHKYMTKDNELIHIQEWESDKNDWQHIHNGDTELVGTNARPKQKG